MSCDCIVLGTIYRRVTRMIFKFFAKFEKIVPFMFLTKIFEKQLRGDQGNFLKIFGTQPSTKPSLSPCLLIMLALPEFH